MPNDNKRIGVNEFRQILDICQILALGTMVETGISISDIIKSEVLHLNYYDNV